MLDVIRDSGREIQCQKMTLGRLWNMNLIKLSSMNILAAVIKRMENNTGYRPMAYANLVKWGVMSLGLRIKLLKSGN